LEEKKVSYSAYILDTPNKSLELSSVTSTVQTTLRFIKNNATQFEQNQIPNKVQAPLPLHEFRPEHLLPQAPQLLSSFRIFVSQPSAALALQLANPELQADTLQVPLEQAGMPLATKQVVPHAPQLLRSERKLRSQPFPLRPSQFA
jgi:hypothetical protein